MKWYSIITNSLHKQYAAWTLDTSKTFSYALFISPTLTFIITFGSPGFNQNVALLVFPQLHGIFCWHTPKKLLLQWRNHKPDDTLRGMLVFFNCRHFKNAFYSNLEGALWCTINPCGLEQFICIDMWLTFDSRGDDHINDFAAVAGVDELIRTERVEAQRTAARLVLCFYHDHHIETVAGEIFSLNDRKGHFDMSQ